MLEDTVIGQRLDEYQLQELLGQGGMALAIASGRGASAPATLSHLSIPDRSVQEMGERALPPLPGAPACPAPHLSRTRPAPPAPVQNFPSPPPIPTSPPPAGPQLIVDSRQGFSSTPAGNWSYLVSPPIRMTFMAWCWSSDIGRPVR